MNAEPREENVQLCKYMLMSQRLLSNLNATYVFSPLFWLFQCALLFLVLLGICKVYGIAMI